MRLHLECTVYDPDNHFESPCTTYICWTEGMTYDSATRIDINFCFTSNAMLGAVSPQTDTAWRALLRSPWRLFDFRCDSLLAFQKVWLKTICNQHFFSLSPVCVAVSLLNRSCLDIFTCSRDKFKHNYFYCHPKWRHVSTLSNHHQVII